MRLRQSDLKTWGDCPLRWKFANVDGLPREQSCALTFGSIIHEAVLFLETTRDLAGALDRFREWWLEPASLDPTYEIQRWLPKRTYQGYLTDGERILADWWSLIEWDNDVVLAREQHFVVPIGEHELEGTLDKLTIRWRAKTNDYVVLVSDYKTSRKAPRYDYLRHDLQFHAYCLATTQPEFWTGIENGEHYYEQLRGLPREAEWVQLTYPQRRFAGERNEMDYRRLAYAINQMATSVDLRIFVPTISGETCTFCLGGSTEIWTAEGVRAIKDVAGTTQRVLSRGRSGGVWVPSKVRSFGVSPVREIHLARGKAKKTLIATPDHRWFVRERKDPRRTDHATKRTDELAPGDVLLATLPRPTVTKVTPSPIGIQAGIVFGDGYLPVGRDACVVALYEHKRPLARYFDGHPSMEVEVGGDDAVVVHGLPRFLNDAPDVEEASSYLLGWLMGYVATDGSVATNGQVTISSSRHEHIELVRTVAARLGIGTYDVNVHERTGYGDEPTPLYRVQFVSSTLPEGFFILDRHTGRFQPRDRSKERIEWTVMDVTDPKREEEVFCATVPEHANFTLDGWINTHNCDFREVCGLPSLEVEGYYKPPQYAV